MQELWVPEFKRLWKKNGSGGRERGQEVAFDEWTEDPAAWEMN